MPLDIEDVLALHALYARYDQYFDDMNREGWLDLFTADTVRRVLLRGEDGPTEVSRMEGRAALEEYWDARQGQYEGGVVRHFSADVLVEGDGDVARGSVSSMVVDYRDGSPHIMNTGRIVDELVKQDGTWRFASRVLTPDGLGGVGGGAYDAKS